MVTRVDLRTNETRKRIINEAQRLFETGGYNELSMEKIAEILGLKRPTLYYHFPGGKEQLVIETIQFMTQQQTAAWKIAIETAHDTRGRLRNILDAVIDYPVFGNERTLLSELWQHGEAVRETVIQCSEQVFKLLTEVFEEGIEKGQIRPVEVELASLSFFGLCSQVKNLIIVKQSFLVVISFVKKFESKILVDKMFEIWMGGLELPSSSNL